MTEMDKSFVFFRKYYHELIAIIENNEKGSTENYGIDDDHINMVYSVVQAGMDQGIEFLSICAKQLEMHFGSMCNLKIGRPSGDLAIHLWPNGMEKPKRAIQACISTRVGNLDSLTQNCFYTYLYVFRKENENRVIRLLGKKTLGRPTNTNFRAGNVVMGMAHMTSPKQLIMFWTEIVWSRSASNRLAR